MGSSGCNLQSRTTAEEKVEALEESARRHCGVPAWRFQASGQRLVICGEELPSQLFGEEPESELLPLCPHCHKAHHLDVKHQHDPCPFGARRSRGSLGAAD